MKHGSVILCTLTLEGTRCASVCMLMGIRLGKALMCLFLPNWCEGKMTTNWSGPSKAPSKWACSTSWKMGSTSLWICGHLMRMSLNSSEDVWLMEWEMGGDVRNSIPTTILTTVLAGVASTWRMAHCSLESTVLKQSWIEWTVHAS